MRILHINKFASLAGGSERYMHGVATRQVNDGHTVAIAGSVLKNQELEPSVKTYAINVTDFHQVPLAKKPAVAAGVVWSRQRASDIACVLSDFSPDVVHIHLYAHQLTSSLIKTLTQASVPFVHTAHDYKLVCPAYVASVEGHDCFECADRLSPKLLIKRCHQGSLPWSMVVGLEAFATRTMKLYPPIVLAPSEFMAKAIRSSWLGTRANVHLLRNPVEASRTKEWVGSGENLLFVGRLSREKGIEKILRACARLGAQLDIAGDGPIRGTLENLSKELNANTIFHGWLPVEKIDDLRMSCKAQLIPSEWPENAPYAAIEAAVNGVPILASRRGGLPEYEALGARLRTVNEWLPRDIGEGLERLGSAPIDLAKLKASLDWGRHLRKLEAIYDAQL